MKLNKKFIIVVNEPLFELVFSQIKNFSRRYFYILHDKDNKKPHYHFYIELYYLTSCKTLSKLLHINENFILFGDIEILDIVNYFIHCGSQFDYIYSITDIYSNFDLQKFINKTYEK